MTLKATDTLLYPNPRLDPADLLGRLDRPDDKDRVFLTKLAVWAAIAGVDDASIRPCLPTHDAMHMTLRNTELLRNLVLTNTSGRDFANLSNLVRIHLGRRLISRIVFKRQRAHMVRVHAGSNSTQVIGNHPSREFSEPLFVVHPVSAEGLAVSLQFPVAIFIKLELPNPARRVVSAILFDIQRIGIRLFTRVMAPQKPHRLAENPATDWVGRRRWLRPAAASALAESDQACASGTFGILSGATIEANPVKPIRRGIGPWQFTERGSRLRFFTRRAMLEGRLTGHRSGPFALVSCPRLLAQRGGFSMPPLYPISSEVFA